MEVLKVPGKKRGSTYYTCIADRGFLYRNNKIKNEHIYLVCVEKGCRARASCDEFVFKNIGQGHNHLPDVEKEAALVLRNSMVQTAGTSSEDVKSIFVRQTASSTPDISSKLAFPSTSRAMRRERRRVQPPMPNTLEEYGRLCQENGRFGKIGDQIYCRGVVGEGDTLSVLFLADNLKTLFAEAKEVHVDGTFKTRPRHPVSSQLLTIMVVHYGYAFPCAFALMASRRIEAYNKVFQKIKEIVPMFEPQLIMSDFEMPLVRSLQNNFPDARKTGCFFHYCQALLKKSRALGMIPLLTSSKDAKKLLMAVALLPANFIEQGVAHVTSFLLQKSLRENFQTLLRYHRSQWLEKVGTDALSVFGRARRTNNDNESFHATLQRLIRVRGPNVWEFTERMHEITAATISELQAFVDEGLEIRSLGKRKYRLHDRKIKKATAEFLNNSDVAKFLNSVTYTVEQLFQNSVAQDDEPEDDIEEFILAPLAGDVPPTFDLANNVDDEVETAQPETGEETEDVVIEEERLDHPVRHGQHTFALCMICHITPPTMIIFPCGHFGLCDECCTTQQRLSNIPASAEDVAYNMVINHSICPIDRGHVERYTRLMAT